MQQRTPSPSLRRNTENDEDGSGRMEGEEPNTGNEGSDESSWSADNNGLEQRKYSARRSVLEYSLIPFSKLTHFLFRKKDLAPK